MKMTQEFFTDLIGKHPDFSSHFTKLKNLPELALQDLGEQHANFAALLAAPAQAVPLRKNQSSLTTVEKNAFKAAIQKMVTDGTYAPLVAIHADMSHMMHGSMGPVGAMRFLAWHRRYIVEFERTLQAADKALRPTAAQPLMLPYWRWQDAFPAWLQSFLPAKHNGQNVPARKEAAPPQKPKKADITYIINEFAKQNPGLNANDYDKFTYGLEGWGLRANGTSLPAHNHVHAWVGGIMNNTSFSPTDPIFWLHHAEVDRIWAMWQVNHMAAHPNLTGSESIMDPWAENYAALVSTSALNYGYDSMTV